MLLAGRDPVHDLELTGAKVYIGTGGQAVKVLGLNGVVRESVLADNFHIGRLCDTFEHVHFYMFYMRPVAARDHARRVPAAHWPRVIAPELDAELRKRFNILLPAEQMRPAA